MALGVFNFVEDPCGEHCGSLMALVDSMFLCDAFPCNRSVI